MKQLSFYTFRSLNGEYDPDTGNFKVENGSLASSNEKHTFKGVKTSEPWTTLKFCENYLVVLL